MKILVINGSPKGQYSTTLYTSLYIQKKFPEHSFEIIHAAAKSAVLKKDIAPLVKKIKEADLVLFSYPVYTFMVPSQLHVLIEALKESGEDFTGKYMTQITTSKHFYDVTAHAFMEENCRDMGMSVIKGLSSDMDDLLNEKGQQQAVKFFEYVLWNMGKREKEDTAGRSFDIAVVADLAEGDEDLLEMINVFKDSVPYPVRVINLRDFRFKGGCLGCLNCAQDGKCIYKDGFDEFLRNNIQNADAIVTAFTVKDHSMGSLFKTYDDRQFCNGHRTVTEGSPVAYLVNGDAEKESNLRTVMIARADVGGNYLAGIADRRGDMEQNVRSMADVLVYSLEHSYSVPRMFYGVGGMKIFRDLIYQMRGFMKADHKFFKEHGQYDFPHKKKGTTAAMYLVGALFSNKELKKKAGNKIQEGMVSGYKKILDQEDSRKA